MTNLRQCHEADLSAVAKLYTAFAAEEIAYGLVAESVDELRQRLSAYCLVAEVENEVVGFVLATEQISPGYAIIPEGERYLAIEDLYVMPALRQQGIGSELLQAVEARARANGIARFLLYSSVKELDAVVQFYRRHGYQSWAIQMYK
ncbi:MAG: GNAT family N-acetyltransferase [Caldilinea sp. CFX5]|nr:GNAT family N-acetyltransferase [Caldilinea sp. CFX5]